MNILDSLSGTESGGNFQAQNDVMGAGDMPGHFGRLQFGQARLQDAMNAGVLPRGTTPQQFMANPALQEQVEQWHLGDMRRQAERLGLTQYVGQTVNGTPITMDTILAMGHLGGMGGAQRYLESGGQYNPSDAYGTSLADYARTHGSASGGQSAPTGGYQPQQPPAAAYGQPQAPQMTPEQAEQLRIGNALAALPKYETNALNAASFQAPQQQNALAQYGFGQGESPFL